MWINDYRKISYISLTIYYIDENWQLKEQILAASKFSDVKHIADHIKKIVLEILKDYNLISDTTMKKFIFVTNSDTNFIAAFRSLNHISCFAYK